MKYYADFHLHSRYSRATSKKLDLEHISRAAKSKGINLMGTSDFTNPAWLYELENNLKPVREGIYSYNDVDFILTTEVNNIYTRHGSTKKIHSLIILPDFKTVKKFNKQIRKFGNLESGGRPNLSLNLEKLAEILFSIYPEALLIPAHLWTPWFGIFGSKSGINSLEEAFGDYSDQIFAMETGLSSDPPMNWMLSDLDGITLISNSDAHSPENIGREANCFSKPIDYPELREILKTQDTSRFLFTVEFFPEEGKYHYDGHRKCNISMHPEEAMKNDNICPVCGKPLTLGVLHRVLSQSDREGPLEEGRVGYRRLIPLCEIISNCLSVGKKTRTVRKVYNKVTSYFGNELRMLLDIPPDELESGMHPDTAHSIIKVREEELNIEPGYDGVYGNIKIPLNKSKNSGTQGTLF